LDVDEHLNDTRIIEPIFEALNRGERAVVRTKAHPILVRRHAQRPS